jgi:hypothetical protein
LNRAIPAASRVLVDDACKALMVRPNPIVRIIGRIDVSRSWLQTDWQQTVVLVCARIVETLEQPASEAVKGGDDVGSRVRIAAAACLVASGLLVGGADASMAFAEPGNSADEHGSAEKTRGNPHSGERKARDAKPGGEHGTNGDNNNGDNGVGNPGNGNCGNGGSNGNAHGCGSGNDNPDDPAPTTKPTTPPTKPTKPTTPPTTEQPSTTEEPPPPPDDPGGCDEENNDGCSPGWPWPGIPGQPPGAGGGGGGGGGGFPEAPSGGAHVRPPMHLPPELMPPADEPVEPTVIDVTPGVGVAAAELPIALPVVVAPVTGLGGGGGQGGAGAGPSLPGAPRAVTAEPPAAREPLPAKVGSNASVPAASYRTGYSEYLRSAELPQVAALAVSGVAGMLVLTGAGGFVGYRQAKAGHAVHTSGTARFMN